MTTAGTALLICGCGLMAACGGVVRDAPAYRDATRELIVGKSQDLRACYDTVLKQDPAAAGLVVVSFKLQAETGQVVEPAVDEAATTAPPALRQCVLGAMSGLALAPPDAREGHATFRWEFKPGG